MRGYWCEDDAIIFGSKICPKCDEPAEPLDYIEYDEGPKQEWT